jgi:hypothetical protein
MQATTEQTAGPSLVRLSRVGDLEPLFCALHQSTSSWIVATEISDSLDLDGLCLLPTATIRCFDRVFDDSDYYRAAVGASAFVAPHGDLREALTCNLVDDLILLAARKIVIAVHPELDEPDTCFVGWVHEVSANELVLDTISSRGIAHDGPWRVAIENITKIEIGTRYLIAVAHAARVLAGEAANA